MLITRDDKFYAPISTAQVNYWVAKQHASGLIVAGGSFEKKAQAAEIWLSSEPEKASQAIKAVTNISFLSSLVNNKHSKTVPIKFNQTTCP